MRLTLPICFLGALAFTSLAAAQDQKKFKDPAIKKIHVGFQQYQEEDRSPYKAGLWTPIYIELFGGAEGIKPKGGDPENAILELETTDSEDVGTRTRIPVNVEPEQSRTFLAYVKTGHMNRNRSD